VGCIVLDKNDGPGCQNFSAGGVVAVPANTLHSAENPGCTPTRAMQALSGAVSTSCTTNRVFRIFTHIGASLTMMQLNSLMGVAKLSKLQLAGQAALVAHLHAKIQNYVSFYLVVIGLLYKA